MLASKLEGKIVLVTGGSRGIGKAITKSLAKHGCKVIISSKNFSNLKATSKELNVDLFKADLRNIEEIEALTKYIIGKYKHLDILVNNAGVVYDSPLEKTPDEQINEVIDVNLKAVFLLTKRLIPYINRGGTIINISSILGKRAEENLSAYCASKSGIIGLTQSLAGELHDVDVVAICPKETNTDMIRNNYPDINPKAIDQPEDVAEKVLEVIAGKFKSGSAVDV